MLGHILEGLQHTEIDTRLHLLREARKRSAAHLDRDRDPPRLRLDRRQQALLGQDWRVQPAGQLAQRFNRLIRFPGQFVEGCLRPLGIGRREILGQRDLEL